MIRAVPIAVLVACLCSSGFAWAQDPPPDPAPPAPVRQEWQPVSMAVAMAGTGVVAAGFGLMLRTTDGCYCTPRTAWVVGGLGVVAAGVTMVWLGLRDRTVTIAPVIDRHAAGGLAVIRWGADARSSRAP